MPVCTVQEQELTLLVACTMVFFEVVILRKLSIIELLKMLFLNRPFNPKKTELLQADALTIEVKKRAYFQIDGEYLGKTRKIHARIQRHALLLIFPKEKD